MTDTASLQVSTPSEHEVMVTRSYAAPRSAVFDALTNPAVLTQWLLGPAGWTMPVCEVDLRVGGKFRFKWRHVDGREIAMTGVYREVDPPHRITNTEQYEFSPSEHSDSETAEHAAHGETLSTIGLAEHAGKTIVAQTIRYDSPQARDAALTSGMLEGMNASYERLETLLRAAGS